MCVCVYIYIYIYLDDIIKMVGWHHQFNGHEFEQTPGDGEKQGSLVLQSMELQSQAQLSG